MSNPLIISEDDYLAQNGAPFMGGAEPALHRTPGGFPKGQRDFHLNRIQKAMQQNNQRREQLRLEYQAKNAAGELRPPTRFERLKEKARGDELMPSVQAARRILAKNNIDWKE